MGLRDGHLRRIFRGLAVPGDPGGSRLNSSLIYDLTASPFVAPLGDPDLIILSVLRVCTACMSMCVCCCACIVLGVCV